MFKIDNKVFTILSYSLLLLAPLLNFLHFNDYGYLQAESLIVAGTLIAIALLLGSLYGISNAACKIALFAVIVTLTFSFFPGWQSTLALAITFFLALLLAMLCVEKISNLLLIFSLVFTISILLLPIKKQLNEPLSQNSIQTIANEKLPPIIYLVLDEHAGLDALPEKTKNSLKAFYLQSGFQVYSSAYSHYSTTRNSLPNLFNFTSQNKDNAYFKNADDNDLKKNKFFQLLTSKGYNIRVYQPDFLNYCNAEGTNISACYTYPSVSIKIIQKLNLSLKNRLLFLTKSFLLQSSIYQTGLTVYIKQAWSRPENSWHQARVSSLNMIETFTQLRADLATKNTSGTVFFAHLLAPHNPFAYDASCRLLPVSQWQVTRGPAPFTNTAVSRDIRYAFYSGQVSCVQKQLQALFTQLEQAGIYKKAIIIVHGDHGSRIAMHALKSDQALTAQDFKDYFITLFAAKLPANTPNYNEQLVDLQTLLAKVVNETLSSPPFLTFPREGGRDQKSNSDSSIIHYANSKPFVFLYPAESSGVMPQQWIT